MHTMHTLSHLPSSSSQLMAVVKRPQTLLTLFRYHPRRHPRDPLVATIGKNFTVRIVDTPSSFPESGDVINGAALRQLTG